MDTSVNLRVKLLSKKAREPIYAHNGDAGLDISSIQNEIIKPFERKLISTGIVIEIPNGYAGFIMPRSGLASKYGITVVNTPGLIDSGYRGEIKVALINLDKDNEFTINVGDRIAQLVIIKTENVRPFLIDNVNETDRGSKGFGSTGV